jgi:hypothetical protein
MNVVIGGSVSVTESKLCHLHGCPRTKHSNFDFCGRTHAAEALKMKGKTLKLPGGPCYKYKLDTCSSIIHYDAALDRVHDFCSLKHAQIHKKSNTPPRNSLMAETQAVCSLPGCVAKVFVDENSGEAFDYCGRSHSTLAKQRSLLPVTELGVDRVFKGDTWELQLLTKKHREHLPITHFFKKSWLKTDSTPTVERIYKITLSAVLQEAYRSKDITTNRMKLFHGSKMSDYCSFGSVLNKAPCIRDDCSMCQIAKHGFKLAKAGSNNYSINLRYGPGLYFSPCSG